MYNQIKITINYFRLKKYLMEKLNYNEKTAIITIRDIRRMKPDLRQAFVIWFTKGEEPSGMLYGINFRNLVTYKKMNPVAAFLAIDWYAKDPKTAYSVFAMPLKDDGDKLADHAGELKPIAEKLAEIKKIREKDIKDSENTDDISE